MGGARYTHHFVVAKRSRYRQMLERRASRRAISDWRSAISKRRVRTRCWSGVRLEGAMEEWVCLPCAVEKKRSGREMRRDGVGRTPSGYILEVGKGECAYEIERGRGIIEGRWGR